MYLLKSGQIKNKYKMDGEDFSDELRQMSKM